MQCTRTKKIFIENIKIQQILKIENKISLIKIKIPDIIPNIKKAFFRN